jgi:hypothetical protein
MLIKKSVFSSEKQTKILGLASKKNIRTGFCLEGREI